MTDAAATREAVRRRYAAAATTSASDGCGCGPAGCAEAFGAALYRGEHTDVLPLPVLNASLGCGVPTAVANLEPGETVLDLGSGAGADVLISARRVGPAGRVIGLDMTDEMLKLARANARDAGVSNVTFVKGYIENIPLDDATVDVVISNCVINLSTDKRMALREAARVLRPGGRLAVSDVIADADMDDATRTDQMAWTGCIAGSLTRAGYAAALSSAGFVNVEIVETHRVHAHAGAAIIRAVIPTASQPLSSMPSARRSRTGSAAPAAASS